MCIRDRGSLGWAAATFFAGQLFNINPNINFWIASISAIILFFIILSISIEMSDEDVEKAQSVNAVSYTHLDVYKRQFLQLA